MMRTRSSSLIPAITAFFVVPAHSADDALYDPVPPPDAAYVRIIDARCGGQYEAAIGGRPLLISDAGISAYVVMTKGKLNISIPKVLDLPTEVDGSKYYSIILNRETKSLSIIEDQNDANPDKGKVYLYNLAGNKSASLVAPKLNATIIGNVASGSVGYRAVNAVTVDVEVKLDDKIVGSFPQTTFRRRSGDSFVVCTADGKERVVAARNETAR